MPSTPYAKLLVAVNGGAPTSGGLEVPSGATIQFSGESTVGWTRARWEIIDYPEGWTAPTGWAMEADGTIVSLDLIPSAIVLPSAAVRWGKWFPRLIVNEQVDNSLALLAGGSLFDDTTAISMLSVKGQRDIAARETSQFTTPTTRIKGWVRDLQRNLRAIEAVAVGSPAGGSKQLQYNNVVMAGTPEWTYQGAGRLQVDPSSGGYLAYGSGTVPAIGVNRVPYNASALVLFGMKDSTGNDRSLFQVAGNTATLGNATNVALVLAGASLALQTAGALKGVGNAGTLFDSLGTEGFLFTSSAYGAQVPTGRIYASTAIFLGLGSTSYVWISSASVALAVGAGQNLCFFTATPTYGGGSGVLFMLGATTAPASNPTGGGLVWFDAVSGFLKVRNPAGRIVTVDGSLPDTMGLRLTLSSGNPIPTADILAATSIFLTPHTTGTIALQDSTGVWVARQTVEVSLALGTLVASKNYDVFGSWSGSAVALSLSAPWASDTVRTDALARVDGVLVKSGSPTLRYLGTIRTVTTTTVEDSVLKRFVWNFYNQVERHELVGELTATWTYNVTGWRQVRAQTANRVEMVCGFPVACFGTSHCMWYSPNGTGVAGFTGIGIDSTSVASSFASSMLEFATTPTQWNNGQSTLDTVLSQGYHAINWLEYGHTATITFYGPVNITQSYMRIRFQG